MATLRIIVMLDDHEIATGQCELSDRKPETVVISRNGNKSAELVAVKLQGGVRVEGMTRKEVIHQFIEIGG